MLYNPLFWISVILFLCSTICLNVFLEYKISSKILPYVIGSMGIIGMIGGFARLVELSLEFNWWWFLGISITALFTIGVFAHFARIKIRLLIATLNILIIPSVWWYGSKFNSTLNFDWFYNSIDSVRGVFS